MNDLPQGPAAVEKVIRTYASTVWRLAYAWMHNPSDADDVFQDVFLRYAEKAPAFGSEEHRKAWLLRVTINRCRSHYRAAWWRRIVPLENAEPIAFPAQDESGLNEAMAKLPPKYRLVIHLHYYENLNTQEIAALTGLPSGTVRGQLTRARAALRKLMEGENAT